MGRFKKLLVEIHQRSVWQALAVYLGASYAVLEAVALFTDRYALPAWLFNVALLLLLVGLPIVLITSLRAEEEYGEDVPVAAAQAAAEEDRRLRLLTWRNAGVALVSALAVWGVVLSGWVLLGDRSEGAGVQAAEFDPEKRIAVLPFSYRGADEYVYLGDGMVDLLSLTLDEVGEVRTVTPRAVFSVLRQYEKENAEPDRDAAIARHLDAARFVQGEIVESGGQLRISARLVHVEAGPQDAIVAAVDGDIEDGIGGLVDALSAQLLVESEAGQLRQLGRVASMTTDSLAALKAFLEGSKLSRTMAFPRAREPLRRAVEIDSTFALAWWQLARATLWGAASPELVREAAAAAVRWSEGLPWRERQLILAMDAYARGDFHATEGYYRAVTQRYPENVSAWLGLSLNLERAPLYGRSMSEALEASRQAYIHGAKYEPDWVDPPYYYWFDAVMARDRALADSLFPLWSSGKHPYFFTQVMEAFCIGDRAAQDSIVATAIASQRVIGTHYLGIACEAGVWRGAEVAHALARQAELTRVRAWAHLFAATYELALGRRGAEHAEFEAARAIDRNWALQYETYWSLPAVFGAEPGELEAVRDTLLARQAPVVSPLPVPGGPPFIRHFTTANDSIHPHIRLYLLGRLSARLGDYDAALRYADEVEALDAPVVHSTMPRDMAQAIRGFVLREQGRYEDALAALAAAPRRVGQGTYIATPFAGEPQERYLRGELLAELGRYDEALRWLSSVGIYSPEKPMRAPAYLLSAQIYERVGAADSAAVYYKRFIDLWRDCDPDLRPHVEAAERALERLVSEQVSN